MSYIGAHKVFAHLDRIADWRAGEKPAPVMVEIDLSNVCTLGCQSCHFAHTHVAGPWATRERSIPSGYADTGKFANPDVLIPALADMKAAGVRSVVWSGGGEPTTHPSFDAIMSFAHSVGLEQGIYTLGGHLSLERAEIIRKHFTWAVVSLDCADAATYAAEKGVSTSRFHDASEGVRRLVGGACVVGVSFLLHAGNWRRTRDMLALSRSLGATYATFRPTIEADADRPSDLRGDRDWVDEAVDALIWLDVQADVEIDVARFEEFRDWTPESRGYATCYGIRLVTQITPDGRVWVCPNRRGMAGSELGDLTRESFADIWARHPGQWSDFAQCRAMCRLHLVNGQLATIERQVAHEAFV